MNVHNIMESIVIDTVNEIFKDKEKDGFQMANSLQCKLDVACYVLNRIKPVYIISGRGLLHFEDNYHELIQTKVDMVTLINEGIKKVLETKRPYYEVKETTRNISTRYMYNFPSIIGSVLMGDNFVPAENISISLYFENTLAGMIDNTWQNPFTSSQKHKRHVILSCLPLLLQMKIDEERVFHFELRIDDSAYDPISHFFELKLKSERKYSNNILHRSEHLKLRDCIYSQKTLNDYLNKSSKSFIERFV
ncbi:MAG: late competence development ComFB family protein [Spirochaetales bacterium]|nr:late competence development ComFB family protein [Spirochaetales bacterium]